MILLDTSGFLAALFPDQRLHGDAAAALRAAEPPLLLSPFVLAELDYLLHRHAGVDTALARGVMADYRDLGIGLADASIVVLAREHEVTDVLTLDERRFRTLRGPSGEPFRILPADVASP